MRRKSLSLNVIHKSAQWRRVLRRALRPFRDARLALRFLRDARRPPQNWYQGLGAPLLVEEEKNEGNQEPEEAEEAEEAGATGSAGAATATFAPMLLFRTLPGILLPLRRLFPETGTSPAEFISIFSV